MTITVGIFFQKTYGLLSESRTQETYGLLSESRTQVMIRTMVGGFMKSWLNRYLTLRQSCFDKYPLDGHWHDFTCTCYPHSLKKNICVMSP